MSDLRTLERRVDGLEHALAGGREVAALKERALESALKGIESEQRQVWDQVEKLERSFADSLKDQQAAFNSSIKDLRDSQWRLITWAAALLATQILGVILKKLGIT